jgi:hypothetical protein
MSGIQHKDILKMEAVYVSITLIAIYKTTRHHVPEATHLVCECTYVCVCVCVCMYVRTYVCACVSLYVRVRTYV